MRAIGFNEGRSCDAVIRLLEQREGCSRTNCRKPEAERHDGPIDFACNIGSMFFAVEHTGVEPFENYLTFQSYARFYIYPIADKLNETLPTQDVYRLIIRLTTDSIGGLKLRRKSQIGLEEWVRDLAPKLPLVREGRDRSGATWYPVPDFPFEVSLKRYEVVVKPYFIVSYMIADDVETQRVPRISRACLDHLPKLRIWQRQSNARTIFVLEDNDMALTREDLIVDALNHLDWQSLDCPDEIYLVNTEIEDTWYVRRIEHETSGCYDLGDVHEVDARSLANITGR